MSFTRWQLLVYLLVGSVAAEETTTGNLIDDYGWLESGGILNHYNHHHTDFQGGSVTQTIDLSEYEGQLSYNYNTSVYGCGNRIGGDCSSGVADTFTVTLTLDTGETWTDTIYTTSTWQEVDLTYTPTEDAQYATLELYGQDNGYWAGWYGPVFYSGSFTVTFDPTLTEVIMPAANPELTTVLPADPMSDPSMGMTPDVTAVEVPQVQVQTVEVQAPTPVAAPVAAPQPAQAAPQTAQAQPQQQQQSQEQPKSESKSSGTVSVRTAAGVVSANVDVANASTASIGDAFGDPSNPVAQAVMVAVMASNGANLTEARLVQPKLPKAPRMRERGLESRFWLDSLRSEVRFQKYMVDKQWQN